MRCPRCDGLSEGRRCVECGHQLQRRPLPFAVRLMLAFLIGCLVTPVVGALCSGVGKLLGFGHSEWFLAGGLVLGIALTLGCTMFLRSPD